MTKKQLAEEIFAAQPGRWTALGAISREQAIKNLLKERKETLVRLAAESPKPLIISSCA